MCDGAGWEALSYDVRGHVITDRRNTNSITKDTIYTYNFVGAETSVTYPSGRTINYTYNAAGQVVSAVDGSTGVNYASNAAYNGAGTLASLQNGTSIVSNMFYNTRLQPCRISVKSSGTAPSTCSDTHVGNILDYTYNFSLGAENNGNVTSVTNNITPGRSQSYTYDELNRISTAVAQATSGQFCWGQDFTYDAWANLTNIILDPNRPGCSANGLSVAMVGNNQLSAPPYHYDAAGNLTGDGTNSYTFNAENQVVTVAGVTYTYDGAGNRVKKSNGKLYWNGDGGAALDETDASGNLTAEYIFFGGTRIARRDVSNNVVYYFSDHLGTAHVVTNSSGTILDDSDFYPFGGERVVTSSSGNAYKFTGKERDTESGLDNFGARYYASTTGRFLSPDDTKYASLADPQTWNLYSYVSNHPLTMTDPTGHAATDPWGHPILPYNSNYQEMEGGGVGSAMSGGDSGGADGDMSGATSDGSESVQNQNDQNNVIVNVKYAQYDVNGADADAAMAAASASSTNPCAGGVGCTTPGYTYTAEPEGSVQGAAGQYTATLTATNVKVTMNITVSTPNWVGYKDASPAEQRSWDAQISKIKSHEEEHVAIDRAGAQEMKKAIQGTTAGGRGSSDQQATSRASTNLKASESRKVAAVLLGMELKNNQLDIWSDHGRN